MINVKPQEPDKKWLAKAKKATQSIIEDFDKKKTISSDSFKDYVWKELKPHLTAVFHGKCAYCEGIYGPGAWMEVEHYRPKAMVTHDSNPKNTVKKTDETEIEKDHPGYYWLAYDWMNLLLTCSKCNGIDGKMNQFPILDEDKRACCPEDNHNTEKPVLLNPYIDTEIENHFATEINGFLSGLSERGKRTIDICNLNREALRTARLRIWDSNKLAYLAKIAIGGDDKIISEKQEFSAYLRIELKKYPDHIKEEIQRRT